MFSDTPDSESDSPDSYIALEPDSESNPESGVLENGHRILPME